MKRIRTIAAAALMVVALTAGSASAGVLITSARIKDNTVGNVDVRNRSLAGTDVRDGSLDPFFEMLGLEQGPKGETGPQGDPGGNGAPGLAQRNFPADIAPGQRQIWTAFCGPGETAVGGGASSSDPRLATIERSFPNGFQWTVQVYNSSNVTIRAYAWALCVPA